MLVILMKYRLLWLWCDSDVVNCCIMWWCVGRLVLGLFMVGVLCVFGSVVVCVFVWWMWLDIVVIR